MKLSSEVDDYIQKQASPQKEICQSLRNIILKTFPPLLTLFNGYLAFCSAGEVEGGYCRNCIKPP